MVAADAVDGPRTASGAVFDGSALVVVDDLEVAAPAAGEVTVRVLASGICHSDLNVLDGTLALPAARRARPRGRRA